MKKCPECGSVEIELYNERREKELGKGCTFGIMGLVLLLYVFLIDNNEIFVFLIGAILLFLILLYNNDKYICKNCNHIFKG